MSATDDLRDLLQPAVFGFLPGSLIDVLLDPANLSTILTALADTHGERVCADAAVEAGWFDLSNQVMHSSAYAHERYEECDEHGCRPLYVAGGEA